MTNEGPPTEPTTENPEPTEATGPAEAPVPFDDFDLPDPVRAGLKHAGFTLCTPIQAKVLPLTLAGKDVAGQAQTGTGKTAAFLISLFTRLLENRHPRRPAAPRALCIAPTRELAVQIAKDAELLGHGSGLTIQAVYGGVDYKKQRDNLRQDLDVLVGTPGRLIDYLKQNVYDLRAIEVLVIDEADRMFDMGFIRDLRFLLSRCTPADKRQSLLFSATLSHDVLELAYMFMNEAVSIEVKPEQVTAEGVDHTLYHVGVHEKISVLIGLLKREGAKRTLVFVNMRRTADQLCRTLALNGYPAEQITGDIDQRKRLKILEDFRSGSLPILVATDVASRGLHIEGVSHVVNYDLPLDPEDYVHRVGRTARAGASGAAISLACERYVESLEGIEKLIGFKIDHDFPEDGLIVEYKPAPRRPRPKDPRGRDGRGGSGRSDGPRGRGAPGGRPTESRDTRPRGSTPPATETPKPVKAAAGPAGDGAAKKRRRRRRRKPSGTAGGEPGGDAGGSNAAD
ncbi:MAG: DEAD/DEAH box helicase [Candidatus Binatia bacterium]|nr:DEAD/DEAH box helicase [Candidatus Binatia bacterium]